jgi:hypothetical protein
MVREADLLPGAMDQAARPATVVGQLLGVMDLEVPQGIGEAQPLGAMAPAAGMAQVAALVPSAADFHPSS